MVTTEKRLYDIIVNHHQKVLDGIKRYDAGKIQLAPDVIDNLRKREKLLKQAIIDTKPNTKSFSKRIEKLEKILNI